MKNYFATYWRENPQLKNGGFYTNRSFEANNMKQARKIAEEIANRCPYGTMQLESLKETHERR